MAPMTLTIDAEPKSYEYLYDRVAVNKDRSQRLGAQGFSAGPRACIPMQIEDE